MKKISVALRRSCADCLMPKYNFLVLTKTRELVELRKIQKD